MKVVLHLHKRKKVNYMKTLFERSFNRVYHRSSKYLLYPAIKDKRYPLYFISPIIEQRSYVQWIQGRDRVAND